MPKRAHPSTWISGNANTRDGRAAGSTFVRETSTRKPTRSIPVIFRELERTAKSGSERESLADIAATIRGDFGWGRETTARGPRLLLLPTLKSPEGIGCRLDTSIRACRRVNSSILSSSRVTPSPWELSAEAVDLSASSTNRLAVPSLPYF